MAGLNRLMGYRTLWKFILYIQGNSVGIRLVFFFHIVHIAHVFPTISWADPGFHVRGAHFKKLRRAEGGAKIVGVFRMKNQDFTPKNHIFFQLRRGVRKFLGYFVWKITILRKKIIFFPILGGGGGAPGALPWIRPCFQMSWIGLVV
jgi:hypothetical protein